MNLFVSYVRIMSISALMPLVPLHFLFFLPYHLTRNCYINPLHKPLNLDMLLYHQYIIVPW